MSFVIRYTKSGERYPRYNPVRVGGLSLCSSDFNRLLLLVIRHSSFVHG
ncbi:hypothetical protein [Coleofasciculus sp. F4-SAH-05]